MPPDSKFKQRMTGIPAGAIGHPIAPASPAERSLMAKRLDGIALGEEVDLPLFGRVWIQLVGHAESNRTEAATFKGMSEAGLPAIPGHAWSYDCQRYGRLLHAAVRDVTDHSKQFGTLGEWLGEEGEPRITDDLIFACGQIYDDVKRRLDPIATTDLTEEQAAGIREAFEKKSPTHLLSFGLVSLVSWLISGAVQLSSSPSAASPSGEPSQDD